MLQYTEHDYLRWENARSEKFELHHGFVVAFAGGTIEHNQIALRMRDILKVLFAEPRLVFTSEIKVKTATDMFFYPDVGVVCEAVDMNEAYVERPRVLVEVLSARTRAYDIIEKRAAYRSLPSLHAYVIVHTDTRLVEVDVRSLGGAWLTMRYDTGDDVLLGGQMISQDEIYGPHVAE